LRSLAILDMSDNEITTLESAVPLPRLAELKMRSNFLRHVSSLPSSRRLSVLDLSDNQISALPPGLLPISLVDLSLANNSLGGLNEDLFDGLRSLEKLNLAGNSLGPGSLGRRHLRDLSALTDLDLSGNDLRGLAEDAGKRSLFASTPELRVLRLADNGMDQAPSASAMSSLHRLVTLDLSGNKISVLPASSLPLPSLTHLHLASNQLSSLTEGSLANCSQVLVLDLSGNQLTEVPSALSELPHLQTLDLSRNAISALDDEAPIVGAKHLWRLQLAGNRLTNVTAGMFGSLRALQVLDLSRNDISAVETGALDSNGLLQALRLDGNRLESVAGLFGSLPALSWLNVSDNRIGEFDYAMLPRSLHWLDISRNRLRELGNYYDLTGEIGLEVLDASFNRLEQLGPNSVPDGVETLLLNDNRLSQIVPYTFFKKTRLVRVDLTVNDLKTIDRNALRLSSEAQNTPDFFLGGNPIECDCGMVWFKSINSADALQNYPIIRDIESIYCRLVYTREVSFVPLVEARTEQFLCPYETHCFALCMCCDFDACDCEMSCPDNCTCYHDSSWSKNIAVCSSEGFRHFPEELPMDATEIFLDGNELVDLDSHTFIGRKNLRVLHLNNSGISTIQNKTFNGLKSLSILHLEDNKLTSLDSFAFEGLEQLRELYLQGNAISDIAGDAFASLRSLEVLDLSGNRLIDFPVWQLVLNPFLVSVRLAENLWSCECAYMERFRSWMSVHSSKIFDAERVACVSNEADDASNALVASFDVSRCDGGDAVATTRIQEISPEGYLPLLAATLASFALVLLAMLAAFVYRHTLRVWLHSKYGLRVFDGNHTSACDDDEDTGTLESGSSGSVNQQQPQHPRFYDVYISYSPKDDRLVRDELAAELERPASSGRSPYRVCLHHRDVLSSNAYVADAVVQASAASRRTVVVLSANFLRSEWSRFDYKSGLHQALRSAGRRKLVVILLGDVSARDLDPDLRLYLKTSIVLQWGDRLFWEKLRYALPDVPAKRPPLPPAPPVMMSASPQAQIAAPQVHAGFTCREDKFFHQSPLTRPPFVQAGNTNQGMEVDEAQHFYQQPRYATYLPPPPPSSVPATSSPSPSLVMQQHPGFALNNNVNNCPPASRVASPSSYYSLRQSPSALAPRSPASPPPPPAGDRSVIMHI